MRRAARAFDANRGERVVRSIALIGAIEDLPVAQLAPSPEADSAGADPAEGECDLREVRACEHARIGDARGRCVAGVAGGVSVGGAVAWPAPVSAAPGSTAAVAALSDCFKNSRRPRAGRF